MKNKTIPTSLFDKWNIRKSHFYILLILTFLLFFQSLFNGFIEFWDDDIYVTQNEDLKNGNIKALVTQFYSGHYHPLTMLFYYIDHSIFGMSATGFHFTNLLLHILNVFLVYIFIRHLTKNFNIAFFVAALFAIHPMTAESVCWISERKNLLYAMFFLLGLIQYMKYREHDSMKHYWYALLFFILSVLSKVSSVSFPLIIIILDIYIDKKPEWKKLIFKIPFFVISLSFGLIAIKAQQTTSWYSPELSTSEHIVTSNYAYFFYIQKIFLPTSLSPFHYYPTLYDPERIKDIYPYLALIPLMIGFFIYFFKKWKTEFPLLLFGFVFFTLNILLVTIKFPKGVVFAAERYSYIPAIGIFLMVVLLLSRIAEKKSQNKTLLTYFAGISIVVLSLMTYNRTKIWETDSSLYSEAIEKYPDVHYPYYNRGVVLSTNKKYKEAIQDFTRSLKIKNDDPKTWFQKGMAEMQIGDFLSAEESFRQTIALKPEVDAYLRRAQTILMNNRIPLDSSRLEMAISDLTFVIDENPNPEALTNRGIAYGMNKNYVDCKKDLLRSLKLNKKNVGREEHYLGLAYFETNRLDSACFYWKLAVGRGFPASQGQLELHCK
jgi:tetratricopeptide (TPR) repeat protein